MFDFSPKLINSARNAALVLLVLLIAWSLSESVQFFMFPPEEKFSRLPNGISTNNDPEVSSIDHVTALNLFGDASRSQTASFWSGPENENYCAFQPPKTTSRPRGNQGGQLLIQLFLVRERLCRVPESPMRHRMQHAPSLLLRRSRQLPDETRSSQSDKLSLRTRVDSKTTRKVHSRN